MSLGIVFGDRKASRRAAIARWAMAVEEVEAVEVDACTLTVSKVRALRQLVADSSVVAEHCDVMLCRKRFSNDEIALSILVIVTTINTRVWWKSRNKES